MNLIWLLIALLIALLLVFIKVNKFSIFAPSCLTAEVFLLSTIAVLLNSEKWGTISITAKTILVILCGILTVFIGEQIVMKWFDRYGGKVSLGALANEEIQRIDVSWIIIIITIGIQIAVCLIKIQKLQEMTENAYTLSQFPDMVRAAHSVYTSVADYNPFGSVVKIGSSFSTAANWVFMFVFLNNIVYCAFRIKDIALLIPALINVFVCYLNTGRDYMIAIMAGLLLMAYALYIQKNGIIKQKMALFAVGAIIVLVAFLAFFAVIGSLQGRGIIDGILNYSGLPVVSLEAFLESELIKPEYFGEETLYGVYNVLRKFGLTDITVKATPLDYTVINDITVGNIYTCLRRYIHDYGYVGMVLLQCIFGAFYTIWYRLAIDKKRNVLGVIGWGIFAHAIVEQSIEERMLSYYLASSTVYLIIFILILYYFIFACPIFKKNE